MLMFIDDSLLFIKLVIGFNDHSILFTRIISLNIPLNNHTTLSSLSLWLIFILSNINLFL